MRNAADNPSGMSVRINQVMHVRAFIKNATPSHAARRQVRPRTKSTSASKSKGIHPAKM
jgi:hypothetical protein